MREKIALWVSALVTSAVSFAALPVDPPVLSVPRDATAISWCSVGTSITWYNNNVAASGGRFTKGYQDRVMEQIVFKSLTNVGVSGGYCSGAVNQPRLADFYTIEHGINDWGNRIVPGTIDDYVNATGTGTFAGAYRAVVNKIRSLNANAHIIVCTPRRGYGFGDYLPATCDAQQPNGYYLKDYVDIVNEIAAYEHFVVADFYSEDCANQDNLADLSIDVALHPNDPGYQKMANILVRAIQQEFPDLQGFPESNVLTINEAGERVYSGTEAVTAIAVNKSATLTGAPITFAYPGEILFQNSATLRFENEIADGYGITTKKNCDLTPVARAGYVPAESTLLFPGLQLADICGFQLSTRSFFGNNEVNNTLTVARNAANTGDGYYNVRRTADAVTVQFQWKNYGQLFGALLELTQGADGVYGRIVKPFYWYSANFPAAAYGIDMLNEDGSLVADNGTCVYFTSDEAPNTLFKTSCKDLTVIVGQDATDCRVELAGAMPDPFSITAEFGDIALCGTRTVNASQFTIGAESKVIVAPNAEVEFTGQASNFPLDIAGKAILNCYEGLPKEKTVTVLDGGELCIRGALDGWGPCGTGTIQADNGGVIRLAGGGALGRYKTTKLAGGSLVNESTGNNLLYRFYMSDGATVTGKGLRTGDNSYYHQYWQYTGSFIETTGTTPCAVNCESLTLNGGNATEAAPILLTFNLAADLTVGANLLCAGGADLADKAYYGFVKKGAATLTLAGAANNAVNAPFVVEAGTLKLAATAAGALGQLQVNGDVTLAAENTATVAFADSSAAVWTDGKTLTLAVLPAEKAIRFGTTANGLTAAQLAAIKLAGDDTATFTLDDEGYLTKVVTEEEDPGTGGGEGEDPGTGGEDPGTGTGGGEGEDPNEPGTGTGGGEGEDPGTGGEEPGTGEGGEEEEPIDPSTLGAAQKEDDFTIPKDEPILLYANKKLAAMESITSDLWLFHSNQKIAHYFSADYPAPSSHPWNGTEKKGVGGIYHYDFGVDANGPYAICQFQGRWENDYTMVVIVKFTQVGKDIYAQVIGTGYPYTQPYGSDFSEFIGKWKLDSYYIGMDPAAGRGMTRASLHNVKMTFAPIVEYTVTFLDKAGEVVKMVDVETADAAVPPTDEAMAEEGYVFVGWDTDFAVVLEPLTVRPIYHKLCTVTFRDADGTLLDTQVVEETKPAVEPDMTGKTYNGGDFAGWDVDISAISDDVVVTAVYAQIPEVVRKVAATGLLDGMDQNNLLIWPGNGTWNNSEMNWCTPTGQFKPWKDGAIAVFAEDCTVSVVGEKNVSGIITLADLNQVTLTGDAITLVAPAQIVYGKDSVAKFVCDVKGTDGFVSRARDQRETRYIASVLDADTPAFDSVRDMAALKNGPTEAEVWFRNVDLSQVNGICGTMYGVQGSAKLTTTVDTIDTSSTTAGIRFFVNDGQTLTCQFQIRPYYGYSHCVKIELSQSGNDVLGRVLYWKHSGNSVIGDDWDTFPDEMNNEAKLTNLQLMVYDFLPTGMTTEIAGDYAVTGELLVNNGIFKVSGEGTMFGGNFTASGERGTTPVILAGDTAFLFDSTAAQTFAMLVNARNAGNGYGTIKPCATTGRFVIGPHAQAVTFNCTSEGLHRFYNGVDVYGTVTLADGLYHLFNENGYGLTIKNGGVLNAGRGNGIYGHRDLRLTAEPGAVINYTKIQSMGGSNNFLTLNGATANITVDYTESNDDISQNKINLSNGALITGTMMTLAWNRTGAPTVTVSGSEPSAITLEKIRVGQSGTAAASNKKMIETFDVSEVTGDAAADLTISSSFYKHATATCEAGNEPYFGFVKKGAGTLLLTGASPDFGASLTLNAGTVAFGAGAVLNGSALILTGDAAIDLTKGAKVSFASTAAMDWTDGKTLNVTGSLRRGTLKFGTDKNGLTDAQLAAITYEGKPGKVYLADDGSLVVNTALTLSIR